MGEGMAKAEAMRRKMVSMGVVSIVSERQDSLGPALTSLGTGLEI